MNSIKRIIKSNRILTGLYRFGYRCMATIFWNLSFFLDKILHKNAIYANCFVFTTPFGRVKKNNWGDDLNDHLFTAFSRQKIHFVPFDQLFFAPKVKRYSLIGSIIGDYCLDHTIIYGSGAIDEIPKLVGRPTKVLSVRGPLSRNVLIENGIECPEVYGDPALLLPLIYSPKVTKKNKIGIIPHYRTDDMTFVSFMKKNYDVSIIDMSQYDKWTDIVDRIRECSVIISESLHGLIVAEAYGIPSVWVEITPHEYPWEWGVKFRDFYESIGKKNEVCIRIYEGSGPEDILKKAEEWKAGQIDYDSMLKAFPFDIKRKLKR